MVQLKEHKDWVQVMKRGKRLTVNGKETDTIELGGISLQLGDFKDTDFYIRVKSVEVPSWED